MIEQLTSFIKSLKANPKVSAYDEAATKQAIILPLLHLLGWDIHNIDEVTPEFSVENRRVDYSLRLNNSNEFFIEVKKPGKDLEEYQEQLLDYSFRQGVELATLTNGMTWWFYLPMKKGDWKARKFYTIDIIQQESNDITSKFVDLLSKNSVQSGNAVQHAESIYKGQLKKTTIEDTLPEAWNNVISEPDTLLINLIAETTEKICGFKPDTEQVKLFLEYHEAEFRISPKFLEELKLAKRPPMRVPPDNKISQDDLIPYIVDVLRKRGGRARKDEVEQEIYQMLRETFQQHWYQETVSGGIPRWQHNLAWAKERAKKKGLIKRPEESGRGYWELTANAMKGTR
ncbi:MAG: winged helix-turn-helix domain-containing protein [Euryarchaeota archaeon]|nr:winged helix-turn-helix domain-containing protein [Euryarchaeota archaeon]